MKKNQVDARREVDEFEGKFHFRNELDKARFRLYNATEKGILSEVNAVLSEFPQLLNSVSSILNSVRTLFHSISRGYIMDVMGQQ
jgi:hypothetical protein